jgi:exonuclease VII small subunit
MSKITNVRLPTVSGSEYNAEQFNQLVRSLEQVILHLNTSYTSYVSENKATGRSWFGL